MQSTSQSSISTTTIPVDAIYIIGPSSTGKTTLCRALAERLDLDSTLWVQEVARSVMKETGYSRDTIGLMEMQVAILEKQVEREREARALLEKLNGAQDTTGAGTPEVAWRSTRIMLSDRSALDPIVYAHLFSPTPTLASSRRHQLYANPSLQYVLPYYLSPSSRFFLLKPIPEWAVDDGVRCLDDYERCLRVFVEVLEELGVKFEVIGAETMGLQERVERVLEVEV